MRGCKGGFDRAARGGGEVGGVERPRNTEGKLKALADTRDTPDAKGGGSGDMFEKLLADSGATVLSLLELLDPVVDRRIELPKDLLLLEHRVLAELGCAWRPKILANAGVEVTSPCPECCVCAAEIFGTLVKLSKLLNAS